MTAEDFFTKLSERFSDLTIFRGVIHVEEGEELPTPYLYFTTGQAFTLKADNIVYFEQTPITLYVIGNEPEEGLAVSVRAFLNETRLPYEVTDAEWNDDIQAWMHTFDFTI